MKKILIVFGTRPEAIKMIPVIQNLKSNNCFDTKVCITAQHREMLDSVLSSFNIVPDYDLSVMKQNQTLSYITQSVIKGLEPIVMKFSPDLVIVHGDTSSAFAGALVAFYAGVPIAHVEAGLRSHDMSSPFPEEFNRRAISLMALFHFAPTKTAVDNLIYEGIPQSNIFLVGNTVIDTMLLSKNMTVTSDLPPSPYILMTVHRREHTDAEVSSIFRAVRRICVENPSLNVIYPIHKNPRFLLLFSQVLGDIKNIILCEPLPIFEFHHLLRGCHIVLTDSGGVQEEASYLGKPVLVVRNNTERPEGVSQGCMKIIGSDEEAIYSEISVLLHDEKEYKRSSTKCYEFGDGKASEKIVEILKSI